jgi:translation initiation factor IF-3
VAKKSQQKMDREKREADAKEAARLAKEAEQAAEVPAGGGLFANAKISEEALKKLTENTENKENE